MRFTIRDLFWLNLTVAITLGLGLLWLGAEHRRMVVRDERDTVRRHAEAMRVQLLRAENNEQIYQSRLERVRTTVIFEVQDIVVVDWELAHREIP